MFKGRKYGGVVAEFWLYAILSVRAVTNVNTAYNKPRSNWELAVMGYYAASGGHSLPILRDNLAVPSSGVKNLSAMKGLDPWREE